MLAVRACEEQVLYFKENGLKKAYNRSLHKYSYTLSQSIFDCQKTDKYPNELRSLRKTLRIFLKIHINELDLNLSNSEFIFEAAYPIKMKIYWYGKALKRKIKRK